MLRGYPDQPSVVVGSALHFHAATSAGGSETFQAHFFRVGATFDFVGSSETFTAYSLPFGRPDEDWGWPTYAVDIPKQWKPGVYLVWLVSPLSNSAPTAQSALSVANDSATFVCVLRDAAPGSMACILYKLPLFTYQAYNDLGNPAQSIYTGSPTVTLRRPGGGAGGHPWDAEKYPDYYDRSSSRQTFAHWDMPMIQWLEAAGYAIEYCTDLDLHLDDGTLINAYRLLLSVGHDEYWSLGLKSRVAAFIAAGGNVAFFSGNTCYRRTNVVQSGSAIDCRQYDDPGGPDKWISADPETRLTGVSYFYAGGAWSGPTPPTGFTVQYADHWVYGNTGLTDGAVFGLQSALVGYECDGAALSMLTGPRGYAMPNYADGTPSTFIILGVARLGPGWDYLYPGGAATLGLYTNGGTVFTAATADWPRVLASGDPTVAQITRNVLDTLSSRSIPIRGLSTGTCSPITAEGASAKFFADTRTLSHPNDLAYYWTSTAPLGPANQPTCEVMLPSPPAPVTITVRVDDGTKCPAFGTLTFTPLSGDAARRLEIMCLIHRFVVGSAVSRKAVQGVGDRIKLWVDPLWDPIRGELVQSVFEDHKQIRTGLAQLKQIANRLEKLLSTPANTVRASRPRAKVSVRQRTRNRNRKRRPSRK
jgi:hypothetical protein